MADPRLIVGPNLQSTLCACSDWRSVLYKIGSGMLTTSGLALATELKDRASQVPGLRS